MKIIMLTNNYKDKDRLWKLACMATPEADRDFIRGTIENSTSDDNMEGEFQGILIEIKSFSDTRGLQNLTEYLVDLEADKEEEEAENEHS